MKQYSFLLESVQHFTKIYHYESSLQTCKEILDTGFLRSASYTGNKDGKYDARAKLYNGYDKYFKSIYDVYYKPVVKKEYNGDYGIHFTCIDMFQYNLKSKFLQSCRFSIDIKSLIQKKYDIVWRVGSVGSQHTGPYPKLVLKKINSVSDYNNYYNDYLNRLPSEEEEVVDTIDDFIKYKKLIFARLPHVVVFAGEEGIKITLKNLEKKQ